MADFWDANRSKSASSELIYMIMNLLFACAAIFLVVTTHSFVFSLVLLMLAKWRFFAVRPTYWLANIKSNLVDIVVGASLILLAYFYEGNILACITITVAYVVWLLAIKPKTSELFTSVQAAVALTLGLMATAEAAYGMPSVFLVVPSFIIGYTAARHFLVSSSVYENIGFLSFVFGLIITELSWIAYHWLSSYAIPFVGIEIPQLAIIALAGGYVVVRVVNSATGHNGKIRRKDVLAPTIFGMSVIVMMVVWFSNPIKY
jgi:hypothetical protein